MSETVHSTRFGTMEVDTQAVLSFPRGLIGLGGSRFALLSTDTDSPFSWLHSVDDPDLALPVTRPWAFFPDYELELSNEEAGEIGLDAAAPTDVWVTVRATERLQDFTANLAAPIVVTQGKNGAEAFQVINETPGAPVRAALFASIDADADAA
jgi:flagellar assembly factor FliW